MYDLSLKLKKMGSSMSWNSRIRFLVVIKRLNRKCILPVSKIDLFYISGLDGMKFDFSQYLKKRRRKKIVITYFSRMKKKMRAN